MMNSLFRQLSEEEEADFRRWARENYTPGEEVKQIWHPVVRDEIRKMCREELEIIEKGE